MEQFTPIFVALAFNGIDLATGIISAIKAKDLKSAKLRDGLFKKIGFILCYFVAWLVDTQGYTIGFDLGVTVLPIIVLYICTIELVSILENICKINEELLPKKLMELFHIKGELKNE